LVDVVYRRRVYERDGWRCGICHRLVKRDAKAPHPLSPSLDHIVPLAAGGPHSYANVQCAHFICNSLKSHTGPGQLRLF
jgi:5-methylcytosine-specific restriction endonuclease McrA